MRRPAVPRLFWPLAGIAGAAAAAVLYRFDPLQVGWYPRCVLFVVTGIYCPGCGALRAGHALLHLDLLAALGYNPLLVAAAPLLGYVLASRGVEAATGRRRLPRPTLSGRMARAILWTFLLFTVLRNVPGAPFDLLRP